MKLNEVRKLVIFNSINITNSFVSKDFVLSNYNHCDNICDEILTSHCGRFLPNKFNTKVNILLTFLFVVLLVLFKFIGLSYLYSLLLSSFIMLNVDFIFSKSFSNFIYRILVKDVFGYKVNKKIKFNDYDFIILKFSNDKKIINVGTSDSDVDGYNPKVYLVHRDYLYLAVFDYAKGGKNSLNLTKLSSNVYSALTLEVDTLNYLMSK